MHIVQVTDDFPPKVGGMASHAWELSKALVQIGHRVMVVTAVDLRLHDPRFRLERSEVRDGVKIVRLGFPFLVRKYRKAYVRRRLERHLRSLGADVLHVHEHTRPADVRSIAGTTPLVFTNHSSMFLNEFESAEKRIRLGSLMDACDWITAPSRELCEKTVAVGFPEERVTYIPNAVDTTRFSSREPRPDRQLVVDGRAIQFHPDACVVVCARKFVHKNGLHVFLDALESAAPALRSRCVVLFAGNRGDRDVTYGREIVARIEALSSTVECHLLGSVPNDEMAEVYRVADISVLPSLKEATSITGLESMASGLPIVGTDVGGIPEIVDDGVSGLLSPPEDPVNLARNLVRLVEDEELRRRMGADARRIVEARFSWPQIARRFVDVYGHAMERRRAPAPLTTEAV
jgi:glycosyltransferase involved in cell wall biosynthesis